MLINKLITMSVMTLAVASSSCSTSGSYSFSGGDVPPYLEFQRTKYRGAKAHNAHLGGIVLKRKTGRNKIDYKTTPNLSSIGYKRTASFTKTSSSKYQLVAELDTTKIKKLQQLSGGASGSTFQTGVYTVYYLSDTKALVDQLNDNDNAHVREYLKRSKDMRIITAVIRVKDHHFVRDGSLQWQIKAGGVDVTDALAKTGEGEVDTEESGKVEEKLAGSKNMPTGTHIHDGQVCAYELARVLWDKKTGKIKSLLVDYPSEWWQLRGDKTDHSFKDVTSDPNELE